MSYKTTPNKLQYKKDMVNYCKSKLIKAKVKTCCGRYIKKCKHIEILTGYSNHFKTNPEDDYKNYLKRKEKASDGYVYVIGNINAKVCKIGFTTNVFRRISSLQTGCPIALDIFCVVKGSRSIEKRLHCKYSSFRMNGEWFRYEGLLKQNIEKTESVINDIILLGQKKKTKAEKNNIAIGEKELISSSDD